MCVSSVRGKKTDYEKKREGPRSKVYIQVCVCVCRIFLYFEFFYYVSSGDYTPQAHAFRSILFLFQVFLFYYMFDMFCIVFFMMKK